MSGRSAAARVLRLACVWAAIIPWFNDAPFWLCVACSATGAVMATIIDVHILPTGWWAGRWCKVEDLGRSSTEASSTPRLTVRPIEDWGEWNEWLDEEGHPESWSGNPFGVRVSEDL